MGGEDVMNCNFSITVLMSVYNGEKFISESIESILQQDYTDFEYILIDDGSTDDTLSVLRNYALKDERIKLIEKNHSGLTESLNVGLNQASGEWIARLDADDIAMPGRLYNQLKYVKENKSVILTGGNCIEVNANGSFVKKHIYPDDHNKLMSRLETWRAFFPHSSAFFHRENILRLGGYNRKFVRSQDWDLWLRIGQVAQIGCLQMPVVKLRKHTGMISDTEQGRLQQINGMSSIVCHFCRKLNKPDPSQLDYYHWNYFLKWVEHHMDREGFFLREQTWKEMRNFWYSNSGKTLLTKMIYLIKEFGCDKSTMKAVRSRLLKENIALKLALIFRLH